MISLIIKATLIFILIGVGGLTALLTTLNSEVSTTVNFFVGYYTGAVSLIVSFGLWNYEK